MRILLYTKETDECSAKRKEVLKSHIQDGGVEIFHTVDALTRRLREPSEEGKIAILLVKDQGDLRDILAIQPLFRNVSLIIQVPDDRAETTRLAHRLRPRYLSAAQEDFGALGKVLRKMLNHPEQNPEMGL
jgi:hypothetical protein